jgi:hypothetical protein
MGNRLVFCGECEFFHPWGEACVRAPAKGEVWVGYLSYEQEAYIHRLLHEVLVWHGGKGTND